MEIKFNFDEAQNEANKVLLMQNMGENHTNYEAVLCKIAHASFQEYFQMLSSIPLPSTSADIKQYRLYILLTYYYHDSLPTVQQIASMFHITETQANTLLKNTLSKYASVTDSLLRKTIKELLNNAEEEDDKRIVSCTSSVIIQKMNMELSKVDKKLTEVSKVRGTLAKYECAVDTFDKLVEIYT